MRFLPEAEHEAFAASLDAYLSDVDGEVWPGLVKLGLVELDDDPVALVMAFERLGFHAVPGPLVDSAAVAPALRPGVALTSVAVPSLVPYALDADVAEVRLLVSPDGLRTFTPGRRLPSVDPSRSLFEVIPGEPVAGEPDVPRAVELGTLATAAQLLGAGQWLLETSVSYARQREQYGRPIGQNQAVKHLLADVATAVELARPLLWAAALTLAPRDVSAAKVACADAAYLAARTGLQVHGAIGYTAEHPLGSRLTKVRALLTSWGDQAFHRARVLETL
ncbi:acyl-CoA dehydrogenase family protein [Amycolatopsis suaedae]|uniref:Acyl-CoA dehydrogenase n=1 Tax=Amycolatopsis suaedae TaxID=2510978 RepID=A0A4Q7J8A7_9PSEU|nr:acyl-CoA dehydrogenase family protein [Amycolatopsis suaedae]RZQ63136.1 acyl-CoA dehydrogenase [Amycolatopsis suaedae]